MIKIMTKLCIPLCSAGVQNHGLALAGHAFAYTGKTHVRPCTCWTCFFLHRKDTCESSTEH